MNHTVTSTAGKRAQLTRRCAAWPSWLRASAQPPPSMTAMTRARITERVPWSWTRPATSAERSKLSKRPQHTRQIRRRVGKHPFPPCSTSPPSQLTFLAPSSLELRGRNNYGIALSDESNPALATDSLAQLRQALVAFRRAQALDPENEWAEENRLEALAPSARWAICCCLLCFALPPPSRASVCLYPPHAPFPPQAYYQSWSVRDTQWTRGGPRQREGRVIICVCETSCTAVHCSKRATPSEARRCECLRRTWRQTTS